MADDIKNLNKQIATFMVVSVALSTAVAANDVIINSPGVQSINAPMLMYAAPEVQMTTITSPAISGPVVPQVEMYAVPDIPIIDGPVVPQVEMYAPLEEPIAQPIKIEPVVAMYAVPDIIREKNNHIIKPNNPTGVMGIGEQKLRSDNSVNIITPSPNLINSTGGKIHKSKSIQNNDSEIPIERATKTENYVNSKYGTVKVLDRGHFIFK